MSSRQLAHRARAGDGGVSSGPVELPDVDRLQSITDAALGALAARLRSVGLAAVLARIARVGDRLDDALRAPMRVWNARRTREPAGFAARLFVLHDPLAPAEARELLGDLAPLLEGGLLEEGPEGILSRVHLAPAGPLLFFGDRVGAGADAVLPLCGATLDLVRAAMPGAPVDRALDLGCGAGAVALLLAGAARHVVATDVSARGLAFARLNARLNGVTNVELRRGDLFEPVRGERFDRIAAQPPFVPRRDGAAASAFVHGGRRGDEVALRLVGDVAAHLAAGGRAVVAADWPLFEGDPIDGRARAAAGGAAVDVLVAECPPKNLDEYCAIHAAAEHRELGDAFARDAVAQRDHLEALGVRGMAFAVVALQPTSGVPWTSRFATRHVHDAPVDAEALDRLFAARTLAFGPDDALAAARLRLPEGARCIEQAVPGQAAPSIIVQPAPRRPEWPVVLEARAAALVDDIARAARVGDAAAAHADAAAVLAAARDALLRGALEPVAAALSPEGRPAASRSRGAAG